MKRPYFSSAWQRFAVRLLDMVYPPSCELCEVPQVGGRYLCDDCRKKLPRVEAPFCQKCGEVFEGNISTAFLCPNCSDLDYAFSFARPVLLSGDGARHLVHILKYGRAIHLARELAMFASEAFDDPRLQRALAEKWTLVPVPLHWARKQHRHFNQSEEIARHLGEILSLPMISMLNRVRATPTQTNLSRKQRLQNLRSAIQISTRGRRWIKSGKVNGVILIDDVFTTGATVQECAQVLRKNLQENIVVVTVVRG